MRTDADTGGGGQRQCGRPQKQQLLVKCGSRSVNKRWASVALFSLAMSSCYIKLHGATAAVPISSYSVQFTVQE